MSLTGRTAGGDSAAGGSVTRMIVHLAYGDNGLDVEVPDTAHILTPRPVPGLPDEQASVLAALRDPMGSLPLRKLVRPGRRVVVVHSDITRPMPNDRVLPVLLSELEDAGIVHSDITLLNALGTHRKQTPGELAAMLGPEVVRRYRCLQHDAWDDANLVSLGETSFGHPVRINRTYMDADVKILTGFIEPHFFAGFSGGPKGVLPSIAGADSVLSNHGAAMIHNPQATWGATGVEDDADTGNPVWEEMLEVALATNPTFLLNVTLNRNREITGVFAGGLEQAHRAGREFCRESAMVSIPQLYDIVITSNSGYPLDQNLYQTVKGMSAAARAVRPGGTIILAAECRDGLPDHGEYANLLRRAANPADLLALIESPGFTSHDQWQVQLQAMVQMRAEVRVHSDNLTATQIRDALLVPCPDIEDCISELLEKYGPAASICVMPEGPQTVPKPP